MSAVAIAPGDTRVVAGYARGLLAEYDVAATGRMLQSMEEAHPIGSAVTHLRFTDDPAIALAADSAGSVFEIVFRRKLPGMKGYTSR